jgi:hypothetical protein
MTVLPVTWDTILRNILSTEILQPAQQIVGPAEPFYRFRSGTEDK